MEYKQVNERSGRPNSRSYAGQDPQLASPTQPNFSNQRHGRLIVGWEVHWQESAENASTVIGKACL